ncbi:DUF1330 domain-containing protein [Paraburkholderia caribensis]|uniref:DUF1330 domain-containing protein n=1 Tax=Paraburkholderia caribensis TaxID=75105 RepID=UPI0031E17874
MSAYVVMIRDRINDNTELETYRHMAPRAREGHAVTSLASYGALEVLEGAPADGVVILQFPSMEDARRWYDSPYYQAARAHRRLAADYRVLIVDGVADTNGTAH